MDGLGSNQVVVIEDEDNPVGDGGNLVDQRGQDSLDRWRLGGLKCAQRSLPDATNRFLLGGRLPLGLNGPQGSEHVGQEADGIVVALVEREPSGRLRVTG